MMVLSGVEIVMSKNFRSVYLINYYQWYWVISIKLILFFFLVINMLLVNGAISSAGEHYIDIVGVTGSIPVSPTIFDLTAVSQCSTPAMARADRQAHSSLAVGRFDKNSLTATIF